MHGRRGGWICFDVMTFGMDARIYGPSLDRLRLPPCLDVIRRLWGLLVLVFDDVFSERLQYDL